MKEDGKVGGGSLCEETESENNWIHSLLALLSHRSVTGGVSSSALLSVISSQAAGRSDGNLEEILPLTFSCVEADEKANKTDISPTHSNGLALKMVHQRNRLLLSRWTETQSSSNE